MIDLPLRLVARASELLETVRPRNLFRKVRFWQTVWHVETCGHSCALPDHVPEMPAACDIFQRASTAWTQARTRRGPRCEAAAAVGVERATAVPRLGVPSERAKSGSNVCVGRKLPADAIGGLLEMGLMGLCAPLRVSKEPQLPLSESSSRLCRQANGFDSRHSQL